VSGPPAAVAAVRCDVRRALADLEPGAHVLVACSGGADSLALAAATAFEAGSAGWLVGLITVDHGLQDGSAERASAVADWARDQGFEPVIVSTVRVEGTGGPEAAARRARFAAFDAAAAEHRAAAVLLGHTLDDQAETVLLGLVRGSGARSLAGMAERRGIYRRPLLRLSRDVVRTAGAMAGITPWEDPHNSDPAYGRVRIRTLLAEVERAAGQGVAANLARTARLLRADADALDRLADNLRPGLTGDDGSLDVAGLAALPDAVRGRVIRAALLAAGVPAGPLGAVHVESVGALVTDWHGQGTVALPRGWGADRRHDRLHVWRTGR
jgi:tRNA(Ile)-lysidine synthase